MSNSLTVDTDVYQDEVDGKKVRAVRLDVSAKRPRIVIDETRMLSGTLAEDFSSIKSFLKDDTPCAVVVNLHDDIPEKPHAKVLILWCPGGKNRDAWLANAQVLLRSVPGVVMNTMLVDSRDEMTTEALLSKAREEMEYTTIDNDPVPELGVHEVAMAAWEEYGDKVAMTNGESGKEHTYSQMRSQVRSCAAGLQAEGLKKGDVVGMFAPNSPEWGVAFFGVLLAGGTVTTLNPSYLAADVEHQLKFTKASFLMVSGATLPVAKEALAGCEVKKTWSLDGASETAPFSELLQTDASTLKEVKVNPREDIAVLPFSSGTTGLPKGVMLTHHNLVTNLVQLKSSARELGTIEMGVDSVSIAVLPFFHIYGMIVLLMWGVQCGAKIVTMSKFVPADYLKLIKEQGMTHGFVAPPLVAFMAKHPAVQPSLPLEKLKYMLCAAAPLGKELSDLCEKRLGIPVVQGYGMTECSPVISLAVMKKPKAGSIGTLMPGLAMKLVDSDTGLALDPRSGERGEIWLRGPQIMKGYLYNPEATADCIDREGWFHTGDIGLMDKDGDIFIVDRLKELIKVKGFQVAPAELEALLFNHPNIADAAVIGVESAREGDGEVPLAFVVKKEGSNITEDDVKEFIKGQVVAYKQIGHVQFTDAIPKNPSGKILRKVLRAEHQKRSS